LVSSTGLQAQVVVVLSRVRPNLASMKAHGVGRMGVDRAQFWAMVDAARTASREQLSRQLELAAARLGNLPPPESGGYRRMQLLAARLGDLSLSEVVGIDGRQPMQGRLGDLSLTDLVSYQQVELLAARLAALPLSEVVGFHRIVEELQAESFRVDLWGAALVINRMGPVDDFWCSEDRLFEFREWLVEQGRQVYQAAIADPDSLADNPELDERLPWGKNSWVVAMTVYEQRTGEELPGLQGWPGDLIGGVEALHSLWADPKELRRRYPRLWARFRQR
jgi:Protein of unknown function (DUF4240)